jgi:uncharacterized protein YyaL (SSP411 family)
VWSADELRDVLGDDAELFGRRFGARPDGNAPADPQGEFVGKNLLYTASSIDDLAAESGRTPQEVEDALERARRALFARREERPRPHLDDKVLTAWNGLMIAAFARAGRILERGEEFTLSARRAATFVREHLWNAASETLLRRYRGGHAAVEAYAEDYAYLVFGLLELFQTDGDAAWLDWAMQLQRRQDALFWDAGEGGWFSTTGQDASVLLRLKEDYDGAEPSASSIGVINLMTLAHLTADASLPARIELTLRMFGPRAAQTGRTVPMALAALSIYHSGLSQIVVCAADEDALLQLTDVLRRRYLPSAVTIPVTDARRPAVSRLLPWIAAMTSREGRPTAYVCRDFACQAPVTSAEAFRAQLDTMGT